MKPVAQLQARSERLRRELREPEGYHQVKASTIPKPRYMSEKSYRNRIRVLIQTEKELEARILTNAGLGALIP